MIETSRPIDETMNRDASRRDPFRLFEQIERVIAIAISALLILAAVLALAGAVALAWDSVRQWPHVRSLFEIVDRLLFVLMIVEILHTVRASIESHRLAAEPFLIVGMIATIRRILVVTLGTSENPEAGGAAALPFDHAMIELGILAATTLVLAMAIYLSRRTKG